MIKVGVVGGTGYTGVELLRLLAQHPNVAIRAITSRGEAGLPVADMFPSLRRRVDLCFVDPQAADLAACDVVFFATPNGIAMQQAMEPLVAALFHNGRFTDQDVRQTALAVMAYGVGLVGIVSVKVLAPGEIPGLPRQADTE